MNIASPIPKIKSEGYMRLKVSSPPLIIRQKPWIEVEAGRELGCI